MFEQAERVEQLLREDSGGAPAERETPDRGRRRPTTSTTTAATKTRARRPSRNGRGPGGRQADRADVVRRRPAGAAGGAARGASGTAARWIRRHRACLPICLGEATKLAQFLLDADKEYDVHGLLRRRDRHRRRSRRRHRAPRRGRRRRGGRARARWRRSAGAITQVPPDYSALKRAGRPLYDYARAGETVEIAAARGRRARAGADVVRRPGGGDASRCAARRGRTCARWRAISGARWAWART